MTDKNEKAAAIIEKAAMKQRGMTFRADAVTAANDLIALLGVLGHAPHLATQLSYPIHERVRMALGHAENAVRFLEIASNTTDEPAAPNAHSHLVDIVPTLKKLSGTSP